MIDCLVFSRDRPLQLDGLLRSLERHALHLFDTVTVLYHPSTPLYALAYLDCAKAHPGCHFWRQGDSFDEDVREWLAGPQPYPQPYVCFLVDDDLFIRDAPDLTALTPAANEAAVSLRLVSEGFSAWRWRTPGLELDYSYPLALDGHILHRADVLRLLPESFSDPTRLEAGLAARVDELEREWMAAPSQQVLVGIPANRVSPSSGMPHMNVSPEFLLDLWQKDRRLNVSLISEFVKQPHREPAAHMEIPLAYEEAPPPFRAAVPGARGKTVNADEGGASGNDST